MMYAFAQRNDTIVFDEPLYAYYLSVTNSDHPGKEEILQAQENDAQKVINKIILGDHNRPVAFFKQMTHHLVDVNLDFLSQTKNIIFIRDPKQIIASYAQVRKEVTMADVGIEKQWNLFNHLTKNKLHCVVLDSNELLKSPKNMLQQLCTNLIIDFDEAMLHWPVGAKPYDGVWAKYWYDGVHQSTGFQKQKTSNRTLPAYLKPLYEASKIYYDQLYPYSIKAG